ncbi:podocalyxin [Mustelus asterias]
MRLLVAVCFLGSWLTTIPNSIDAQGLTSTISAKSTSKSTQGTVSSNTNEATSKSDTPSEAPRSTVATSSRDMKTDTISVTTKNSITVTTNTGATPKEISTVTQPTGSTTVTTTAQNTTTIVQATPSMSSIAPHQIRSNAPTTLVSTTLASSNTTVSENKTTTRVNETAATTIQTTPAVFEPVTSVSTTTVETFNSTCLNSTSSNVTATGATTGGLQTSPATLQNASTETSSRNGTAVKETEQDQTRGTQESTKTESTTRHPGSPANTPEPHIQSEVVCVAESKHQTTSLTLKDYTNCKHFIQDKKEKLSKLLCNKLIERENLKFFTHCEIKLSPEMKDSKKLNIDILFRVDERKLSKLLNDEEKSLKELGLQVTSPRRGDIEDPQTATELKKLIAMVVTGSLLLLVFLSAIIYRCAQRKSQHKKDLCLNEEMHVVDNGCHDNPAMDIIECESEMQEKANSKTSCQENMDGWIVPIDSLTKNELEEEDTHL